MYISTFLSHVFTLMCVVTVCVIDKDMPYLRSRPTTLTPIPRAEPVPPGGTHDNIIPLYCAVLGLVIVGLIVYVGIKRMQIRRHKKASQIQAPILVAADAEGGILHKRRGSSNGIYMEKEGRDIRQGVEQEYLLRSIYCLCVSVNHGILSQLNSKQMTRLFDLILFIIIIIRHLLNRFFF